MNFEQIDLAKKLRKQGKMPSEIASILQVPYNTVKAYFRRHKDFVPGTSKCFQCGKTLKHIPGKKTKKFCSDDCRMEYWNSHLDEVNRMAYYKLVCQYCGKEYLSYGNKTRKYCSRKCYRDSLKAR